MAAWLRFILYCLLVKYHFFFELECSDEPATGRPTAQTAGPGRQPAPAPSTEGHVRYLGHGLGKTGPLALRQQEALFEKIALCSENLGTAAAFFFFYFFTLFQMLTPPKNPKQVWQLS